MTAPSPRHPRAISALPFNFLPFPSWTPSPPPTLFALTISPVSYPVHLQGGGGGGGIFGGGGLPAPKSSGGGGLFASLPGAANTAKGGKKVGTQGLTAPQVIRTEYLEDAQRSS